MVQVGKHIGVWLVISASNGSQLPRPRRGGLGAGNEGQCRRQGWDPGEGPRMVLGFGLLWQGLETMPGKGKSVQEG